MHEVSPNITSVTYLHFRSTMSVKNIFSDVNKYVKIRITKNETWSFDINHVGKEV